MIKLTDSEIIESIKRGNQSDYSILVDRYKNKAYSLLKRMLKNNMEAEEVLQDSFLKAFQALSNFKGEAKFSTWFYRIVYNTALTKLSTKKRKIEMEMSSIDDYEFLKSGFDIHSNEKEDTAKMVNELINRLPEKNAAVVSMFYLDEMSCEEISNVMNLNVTNIKVLLYRSRNILRDMIVQNNLVEELR